MAKVKTVLALVGVLGICGLASAAHAEDMVHYCHSYAVAAVDQSRTARQFNRCHHYVRENAARWSLNYYDHFNWCKSVYGSGDNSSERHARDAALGECTR
jgi:hypothetical protein